MKTGQVRSSKHRMCKCQIEHNASGPSISLGRDTLCKPASHLHAAEGGCEKDSVLFIPDNLLHTAGQYKMMHSAYKSQGLDLKLLPFEKKKREKQKPQDMTPPQPPTMHTAECCSVHNLTRLSRDHKAHGHTPDKEHFREDQGEAQC